MFGDIKREAVTVSNETLLSRGPDVVIDLHYGSASPPAADELRKERDIWNSVSSVPAVKHDRVYLLYGDRFVVPGPRIAQAAEELARVIHPEAFR